MFKSMKKVTILLFSLIALFAIILFFFFQSKDTQRIEKKTKVIQQEKPKEVNKEIELKLTLDPSKDIDTSKYQKNEDYSKSVPLGETPKRSDKKDLDVNVGVDFNKEQKSIDGVELNIQKKF